MKIVAIRGCDLASLAGDFAIELEQSPLAEVGVFAITGPTGAGKSTLLDAMCVALFDRTPRLQARGGALIGRADEDEKDRLAAYDVRSLLRRGAGTGHAEVEFIGRDGRRYVARWTVRRARNRVDGRFQPTEMTLTDVAADKPLGGTKSETLAAINDKLGLSFEQFTRSALLAQGDFSAFLRASSNERAELLERMTGTEIYRDLSIAAYRRSVDERGALGGLVADLGKIQLLADDERAALEEQRRALAERVQRVRARLEAAQRVAKADKETSKLRDEREQRAKDAKQAEADEARASIQADQAKDAVERAEQALELARPDLDRAADLDSRVAQAQKEAQAAQAEAEHAAKVAEQAQAAMRGTEGELEAARCGVGEATAWLATRAELQPLVDDWGLARKELAAYAEARAAAERHDGERAQRADALEAARAAVEAVGEREQAARDAMKQAEAARTAAEEQAAAHPTAELQAQLDAIDARRVALNEVAAAHANAVRLRAEVEAAEGECEQARGEGEQATSAATAAESERRALVVRLEEAEGALARAREAKDLEAHRAELVDGQECPLCGATEHPYAGTDAAITALVDEQRERVAELRGKLTEATGAEAAARERAASQAQRAQRAADTAHGKQAELAKLDARHAEASDSAALRELALAPSVLDAQVGPLLEQVDEERRQVRERQAEGERLAKAAAKARTAVEARRTEWLAAKQAHEDSERAAQAATEALRDAERALEAARATAERAVGTLAPLLERRAGWRDELARDAVAFGAACKRDVEAWREQTKRRDEGAARVAELKAALAEAKATEKATKKAAADHADKRDTRAQELAELRTARGELFEGRATAAVREQLEGAVQAAAKDVRAAGEASKQASVQLERAKTKMQEADRNLAALAEERAAAVEAFGEGEPVLEQVEAERNEVEDLRQAQAVKLDLDDKAREQAGELTEKIAAQQAVADVWGALSGLIGSSDGKKFRVFAQSLTLDALLAYANRHLQELAPRYRLVRVPGSDLDLQVVDRDLGDEVRSVHSLSGGETFLVSLALALGLSSVSARDTQVDSLLIDEGFGTLDPETLEIALATLDTLQASGRKVGLISHVPGLAERIGAQVQVTPRGAGRSTVQVVAG